METDTQLVKCCVNKTRHRPLAIYYSKSLWPSESIPIWRWPTNVNQAHSCWRQCIRLCASTILPLRPFAHAKSKPKEKKECKQEKAWLHFRLHFALQKTNKKKRHHCQAWNKSAMNSSKGEISPQPTYITGDFQNKC